MRRQTWSTFHCRVGWHFYSGRSRLYDWVRPGIILYGASSLEDRSTGIDFGCQPVMSLTSSLIAVREHKAGEPGSVMVEPG
ncbi:hypothetical protein MJK70_01545 [Klebsiella pneumoniae]|nr:hypothetical protein MJK70_01545 [Klebsiella pneumoniae]